MNFARKHKQTLTYWAPSTRDTFGDITFGAPATQLGRWEERTDIFVNGNGAEQKSAAVAFLTSDVAENGYLFLGTSAAVDPSGTIGARRILQVRKVPNRDATQFERRAMLG